MCSSQQLEAHDSHTMHRTDCEYGRNAPLPQTLSTPPSCMNDMCNPLSEKLSLAIQYLVISLIDIDG